MGKTKSFHSKDVLEVHYDKINGKIKNPIINGGSMQPPGEYYTNAIFRFQEDSIVLAFNKKQNVIKWKDIIHFGLAHEESLLSEAADFEIQTRDGTFHFSVTRYKFKSKRRMISDILNLVMEFPDAQKKTSEEIKEVINILQLKSSAKNVPASKS